MLTSTSRALTASFADAWDATGPQHTVIRRDLHADQLPHLPTNAMHWAARLRTADEVVPPEAEALQQKLIDEVVAADVVLIGAPMYNWAVPSTLKAWIDYVHVPGVTTPFDGPTQPLAGKPAIVVSSRGDQYGDGTANVDHELPALQQVLGAALGMTVTFVIAELTLAPRIPAMAPLLDKSKESYASAREQLAELVRTLA
jgi:FMN-dependent NADH-azoreductase